MKFKNLTKVHNMLFALIVGSLLIFGSCKEDDEVVQGDKTELNTLIVEADALAASATSADYPQAAIDNYKATIASVKDAVAGALTQAQIDNLVVQLTEAMDTFMASAYGFIDESLYLNAGWHFDEGTGTTATAYSTVKHVGTFTEGNAGVFGAEALSPTWVAGVKGGNAVYLDKGANLQVPYTTAFIPVDISISVWIKPIELYENNYILSQNYWEGYKLQTQGGGKPFFTYKSGDEYINKDNETDNSIKVNEWNHIVITLNSTTKIMKFFVAGTLTKEWTSTEGILAFPQTLPSVQPFIIGCVATDAELATWTWTETPTSLGYFKGAIDELKIYNIALADGQVSKLYNDEKP
ncbi:MAG: hypothetical protein JEZ09_05685 [Salinivirgaceae bacterium]|nr:hypothetical protein [Salinivirgaceae bacterium]